MLHKLNNIRSLRALSREFSIDVLEEMLEKLRIVTEEKRTQQQQAAQQQAEYQEKVNTRLELMRADGISLTSWWPIFSRQRREAKASTAPGEISLYRSYWRRETGPDGKNAEADCRGCRPSKSLDSF